MSKYHRVKSRRGGRRALVAVGHSILKTCYIVLKNKVVYKEFNIAVLDNRKKEKIASSYIKRLTKMGFDVTLNTPAAETINTAVQ